MTALRQRMDDAMVLRGFALRTRDDLWSLTPLILTPLITAFNSRGGWDCEPEPACEPLTNTIK